LGYFEGNHPTKTIATEEIRATGLDGTDLTEIVSRNGWYGGAQGGLSVFTLVSEPVYGLIGLQIARQEGVAGLSVDPKERRFGTFGLKRN